MVPGAQAFRRSAPHRLKLKIPFSFYLSLGVVLAFVVGSSEFLHWFVLPLMLAGTIIGLDAVDWFRGRINLLDPAGLLGIVGFYFFLISPLLMVAWNYRMLYLPVQPWDYRPWLGGMGLLNCAGLIVYRAVRKRIEKIRPTPVTVHWRVSKARFDLLLVVSLIVTAVLQAGIYASYGGLSGYIAAYEAHMAGAESFKGWGVVFAVSECFPILAMFGFAVVVRRQKHPPSWPLITLGLTVFLFLQLIFGGLRGSRANTIWGLFWAAGIVHFYLRPLSRKVVLAGISFLLLFMYLYAFYKNIGSEALTLLQSGEGLTELSDKIKTSNKVALNQIIMISDLSRCDVQAFLLYRMITSPGDYEYALGRTYLGTLALMAPSSLWPDRPPTKVKWTTEAENGIGTFGSHFVSSRIAGLAGEAMLNFGPVMVPFIFAILGLTVGAVRRLSRTLPVLDSRFLMLPFLINFCLLVLLNDSDNALFYIFKYGAPPFLLLWVGSVKKQISRVPLQRPIMRTPIFGRAINSTVGRVRWRTKAMFPPSPIESRRP